MSFILNKPCHFFYLWIQIIQLSSSFKKCLSLVGTINSLKPNKWRIAHMLSCSQGIGKDHAKYMPVATAAYQVAFILPKSVIWAVTCLLTFAILYLFQYFPIFILVFLHYDFLSCFTACVFHFFFSLIFSFCSFSRCKQKCFFFFFFFFLSSHLVKVAKWDFFLFFLSLTPSFKSTLRRWDAGSEVHRLQRSRHFRLNSVHFHIV